MNDKKILVAYFSASGATAKVAKTLAQSANADMFEIKPQVPYTQADLNWMDKKARSTIEMKDKNFRPAIAEKLSNMDDFDVVFLGFPIWWYVAPTIINTFLEEYDLAGKTVANLKGSCSDTTKIIEGKILNSNASKDELTAWVASL